MRVLISLWLMIGCSGDGSKETTSPDDTEPTTGDTDEVEAVAAADFCDAAEACSEGKLIGDEEGFDRALCIDSYEGLDQSATEAGCATERRAHVSCLMEADDCTASGYFGAHSVCPDTAEAYTSCMIAYDELLAVDINCAAGERCVATADGTVSGDDFEFTVGPLDCSDSTTTTYTTTDCDEEFLAYLTCALPVYECTVDDLFFGNPACAEESEAIAACLSIK